MVDIKNRIRKQAEDYYRQGDYYCSEAIIRTIRDEFKPDNVIAMASGFPVGMGGSGCTCGALVGGIMALGLFFGRKVNQEAQRLSTLWPFPKPSRLFYYST